MKPSKLLELSLPAIRNGNWVCTAVYNTAHNLPGYDLNVMRSKEFLIESIRELIYPNILVTAWLMKHYPADHERMRDTCGIVEYRLAWAQHMIEELKRIGK